jgi:two-component system OmpR family response regulator
MSEPLVILVVDDEKDLRESLTEILQRKNYKVITAESGNKAYMILEERRKTNSKHGISLILSDWMMNDGNGIELLGRVRGGEFRSIPFILMSGAVTKEELHGAVKHGLDGILLKPFNSETLYTKIIEAIINRQQQEIFQDFRT